MALKLVLRELDCLRTEEESGLKFRFRDSTGTLAGTPDLTLACERYRLEYLSDYGVSLQ